MKSIYRVGILGHGFAGRMHKDLIESHVNNLEVVAIADYDKSKLLGIENCQLFTDYEKLIHQAKVDAFIVALPNTEHFAAVKRITNKKIPMLLEKPLGITLNEGEEIAQYIRSSQTHTMVALTGRFHPEFSSAYEALKNDDIGRIVSMQERIHFGTPDFPMNYVKSDHGGRGIGLENGIHTFERIAHFSGSPILGMNNVYMSNRHLNGDLDDCVSGQAVTGSGLSVPFSLQWTRNIEEDYVFRMTGTKGTLIVRGFKDATLINGGTKKILYQHDLSLDMSTRHKTGFINELNQFADFLKSDKSEYLLQEALEAQKAVELLYSGSRFQ